MKKVYIYQSTCIVSCLQVLSGKLMPTVVDMGSRASSNAYFEDFLTAGGLSLVVNVLQPESLSQDIHYSTRQGCYSVCLQLARYSIICLLLFCICISVGTVLFFGMRVFHLCIFCYCVVA